MITFSVENPHFAHISLTKQGGLIQNLQTGTIIWSLISVASGTSSRIESSDGKGGVLGKQVAQEAKIFKSVCKSFVMGWMNLAACLVLCFSMLCSSILTCSQSGWEPPALPPPAITSG